MDLKFYAKSEKQRDYAMSYINTWLSIVDQSIATAERRMGYEEEKEEVKNWEAWIRTAENGKQWIIDTVNTMDAGQIIEYGKMTKGLGETVESQCRIAYKACKPMNNFQKAEIIYI
ncbi:MAG: hypothetical protein FWH12_02515 [Treponema sp.]|nr:hypothetical protein [Treponema sp.]